MKKRTYYLVNLLIVVSLFSLLGCDLSQVGNSGDNKKAKLEIVFDPEIGIYGWDIEDNRWELPYEITIRETNGVSIELNYLGAGNNDYSSNINNWIGTDIVPANGSVSFKITTWRSSTPPDQGSRTWKIRGEDHNGNDVSAEGTMQYVRSSDDPDGIYLEDSSYTNSGTTNNSGEFLIDLVSFNKDVKLKLVDKDDNPVANVSVNYVQNNGHVGIEITDAVNYYAPLYYFDDLNQYSNFHANKSIGIPNKGIVLIPYSEDFEDSDILVNYVQPKVVVSGTILVITLALSFYEGLQAGDALYDLVDFFIENWESSTLEKSTFTTTVGEVADLIKSSVALASLPAAISGNIAGLASGQNLTIKKAIEIGKNWTTSKIKSAIISYLIDATGKLIGDTSEIRVTIYHFDLTPVSAISTLLSNISPMFTKHSGAIEIELINAHEEDYSGDYVVADSDVDISGGYAYFTVNIRPEDSDVTVTMDLVGTDGYIQHSTETTDINGQALFVVPIGASGVQDVATVEIPISGYKKVFAWTY